MTRLINELWRPMTLSPAKEVRRAYLRPGHPRPVTPSTCSRQHVARPSFASPRPWHSGCSNGKPERARKEPNMKAQSQWALPIAVLALGLGLALSTDPLDAQQQNLLSAAKTSMPPALDGSVDAAWRSAPALTVKAVGGKNLPAGT